jgi:type IV fimbrial biogenesis protein FimT
MPDPIRQIGFTLVELMVGIAVLAILSGIAVPSFREFTANQRLRGASFDLRTDLTLARSEALKRNRDVTIQRRTDAGWQSGWVVTTNGQVLRSRNDLGSGVAMSVGVNAITFNGNGRVSSPAGAVEIDLATTGSSIRRRCVLLDPAGVPRSYEEKCS